MSVKQTSSTFWQVAVSHKISISKFLIDTFIVALYLPDLTSLNVFTLTYAWCITYHKLVFDFMVMVFCLSSMSVCLSLDNKLLEARIMAGWLMPYSALQVLVDDCFFMLVVIGDDAFIMYYIIRIRIIL